MSDNFLGLRDVASEGLAVLNDYTDAAMGLTEAELRIFNRAWVLGGKHGLSAAVSDDALRVLLAITRKLGDIAEQEKAGL